MCGRFSLSVSIEDLKQHFQLQKGLYLKPRYNISPSETIPVIKIPREIDFLQWGFVAKWMDPTTNKGFINARSETVSQKPAFREAFRKRRCLIVVDGYYEWKQLPRVKQPYYIRRTDTTVFAFAGIWEGDTCAILTTDAHARLFEIHPRMPVIIDPENYLIWLDPTTPSQQLESLLCVSKSEKSEIEIYPVSTRMNDPLFEGPDCIRSLQ
jgi:putative SOS response-associated peptidase YedK